ncbi:MAG: hypothetical protein IIA50_05515, partial [Bacteroidetes bacterium]|nr:hypothetical protein [Bacteroidota bacterium]
MELHLGRKLTSRETSRVVKRLGQLAEAEPVISNTRDLLRYALQHEAKGAKAGYRAGQLELTETHENLVRFAQSVLPASEQRRLMPAIAAARTPAKVQRAI